MMRAVGLDAQQLPRAPPRVHLAGSLTSSQSDEEEIVSRMVIYDSKEQAGITTHCRVRCSVEDDPEQGIRTSNIEE